MGALIPQEKALRAPIRERLALASAARMLMDVKEPLLGTLRCSLYPVVRVEICAVTDFPASVSCGGAWSIRTGNPYSVWARQRHEAVMGKNGTKKSSIEQHVFWGEWYEKVEP